MADISFYHQRADEFVNSNFTTYPISGKIYNGLTPLGFTSNRKIDLSSFRALELVAALDAAQSFFSKSKFSRIKISSFDLADLFQNYLDAQTNGVIFDIKNGEAILAMLYIGYEPIKVKGSKEVFFKVTQKEINHIIQCSVSRTGK